MERATIIQLAQQGQCVPAIAKDLHRGEDTVRLWLKRFNRTFLTAPDPNVVYEKITFSGSRIV